MFLIFPFLTISLKPILVVPGLAGSNINVTVTDFNKHSECPSFLAESFRFWPVNLSFVNEYPDCMGKILRCQYDEKTKIVRHVDGMKFDVDEFGTIEALPYYTQLFNNFVNEKGYVRLENIFALPYDWIVYYDDMPIDFFEKLQNYIDHISMKNGNQKVVLIGHSLGANLILSFLNKNMITKEWIEKRIDSLIFMSPAFSGCFLSLHNIFQGMFNIMKYNKEIEESIRQMPSLLSTFQNYEVFSNDPIVINANNNETIYANSFFDYLIKIGKMTKSGETIFKNLIEKHLVNAPIEPRNRVRSLTLYNDGFDTVSGYDASSNFSILYSAGDGNCIGKGMKYLCEHWHDAKCYNFNSNDRQYDHSFLVISKQSLEQIWAFINEEGFHEL